MKTNNTQRYFIRLSYNGTNYHGWQIQPNGCTIQGEIEEKLGLILGQKIDIVGAGRTDTGVHARNFIAHFNPSTEINNNEKLIYKLNSFLPKDIAIHDIFAVNSDAHARFSATSRTYKYYIAKEKDPFRVGTSLYFPQKLNLKAMQVAAEIIMEYKDFEAFSKSKTEVNNFNCEITESYFEMANHIIIYTITANRFLRNMVRAIVGTLLEVGKGNLNIKDFRDVIASKNRSRAGKSVDGKALFLNSIEYPNSIYK